MATSSETETECDISSQKNTNAKCLMHFHSVKGNIIPFKPKSWSQFLKYTEKWRHFKEGRQAEIARAFRHKNAQITDSDTDSETVPMAQPATDVYPSSDIPASTSPQTLCLPMPLQFGYHRSCYSRFTDVSKLKRAESKQYSQTALESTTESALCPTVKTTQKHLRSKSHIPGPSRSVHVLPKCCILCKKEKYIKCRSTRKSKLESLVNCSTIKAERLKQAATDNNNEELLLQIAGKDCVAIELRYHHSCYNDYTRYLSKATAPSQDTAADTRFLKSYETFCSTVRDRLIVGKEIFRMTKLTQMFVVTVKETEEIDISGYKSNNLKKRLKKSFPQLCFLQPRLKTQSDIVYVNDLSTEVLVEENKKFEEVLHCSTSTDGTSGSEEFHIPHCTDNHDSMRELFIAARSVKEKIDVVSSRNFPWPPRSEHLTLQSVERLVPSQLYNFLAWVVGGSSEPHQGKFVPVNDPDLHRRILNISQDIIYTASRGRKQMPKQISLGMTLRHLTGSAQLIGLLNGFGYCSSHSSVLEHDTALALQEMNRGENALPSCVEMDRFTTLVWDNNDFREETRSGKGTTHNTNGIIIQRPDENDIDSSPNTPLSSTPSSMPSTSTGKTKKRSVEPPPKNILHYHGGPKAGPKHFATHINLQLAHYNAALKYPQQLQLAYNLTKFEFEKDLPNWTGFNQLTSAVEVPPVSTIGYLPIIDASPTEMDTVFTILQRSVDIADKLNLDTIVVVMDQAIYSKAQMIRWGNATFMQRVVMRLGAFHTAMSYLGCIGKRFRDAGLQDVIIESEVIAAGSINGAMSGHHYNRSVRAHKLMYEALQHLKVEAFLQSVPLEKGEEIRSLMKNLQNSCHCADFQEVVSCEEFHEVEASFMQFVSSSSATNQTFAFWNSYTDMVEVLLLFMRSIREGNWQLHLSSIRSMLPWIFAYDHINYARYLPAYWLEMCILDKTHPEVHQQFMNSNFVVQRSTNAFAQTACDQTIEQTVNRDSKTRGGMVGFTTSVGAVNRWIWSHHQRAAITRGCEAMAGTCRVEHSGQLGNLQPSRIKQHNESVKNIIGTLNDMVNPFNYEHEELVHITSGVIAANDVARDLKLAFHKGDAEFVKFSETRLQKETNKGFFDPLSKMKLKTFTTMTKTIKSKVGGKTVALKSDRSLLARLVVIGKVRKIDLKELLIYNLGPLPLPLSTVQGLLVKTNKANLMRAIENNGENSTAELPQGGTYIVDGMAFIQQLNTNKLPGQRTFANLAQIILSRLVNMAKSNGSESIHFVTDRYPEVSIKNAERKKRAVHGSQIIRVYGQNLPQQWKKFLASGQNKESLLEYVFHTWKGYKSVELKGVKVFYAHGGLCHAFSASHPDEDVDVNAVDDLACNHEEADTRLFLHAAYAAQSCTDVVICSPDTDVFIIGLTLLPKVNAHVYFHTGVGNRRRTLDLQALSKCYGESVCDALIGLHCLTGCDSISAFYGKGKKKAFNLLLKNDELCAPFKQLGESFDVQQDLLKSLEHFVCQLYGQKDCGSVNDARYNMFRLTCKSELVMPPNQDSLYKHIHRANYQAVIYKQSLCQAPDVPSPVQHGWKMTEGELAIDWSSLPAAPDSVLALVHCTGNCKKNRCLDQSKCSCLANNLPCTDLCYCKRDKCCNAFSQIDEDENVDNGDSDADDE